MVTTNRLNPAQPESTMSPDDAERFHRNPAGGPEIARGWLPLIPGKQKPETTELWCDTCTEHVGELLRTEWIAKSAWADRHDGSGHDVELHVPCVKLIMAPMTADVPGRVLGRAWVHLHARSRKPIWRSCSMDPASDHLIDLWPRLWVAQSEWHREHFPRNPQKYVVPVAIVVAEEVRP